MKIYRFRFLLLAVLCSALLGCSSGLMTNPTQVMGIKGETSAAHTIQPPTSTLSPSPEPSPTSTPTSPPTATPTITFTPSSTPLSFEGAVIDETNFADLEKFLTLGKGNTQFIGVSEDGRFQIVPTVRGLYLYETETLEELAFFEGYGGFTMIPGKSEMIAVSPDLTLAIINLENQSLTKELEPPDVLSIGMMTFSEDTSHMAVTVSQPHPTRQNWTSSRIDIWNLDQGALVSQLESDLMGRCGQLSFSLDNSQLITACSLSGGGYPRLFHWDTQTGTLNWSAVNESVTSFPFSKDGSLVATSLNAPNYIIIRTTSSGTEVGRVSGGGPVNHPFSPDNKYLLTVSGSGILVWNVSSSQLVKTIRTDFQGLPSFSDDCEYILVSGGQRAYRVSDFSLDENYPAPEDNIGLASQEPPEIIPVEAWLRKGHLSNVMGVELFEDDRLFVWGVRNQQDPWREQTLWWWYPDQDVFEEIALGKGAGQPAWSPLKDQMAVCTQDGLKMITIENGEMEDLGTCRSSSSPVAFSADGKRLFLGSGIVIDEFDIETRSVLSQLRGHDYNIGYLRSSDDAKFLFSTSADEISGGRESIIWRLDPHTFTKKWFITYGSDSNFSDAHFTPDNANLVAIFGSKISVWRVSDGWYLASFEGNDLALLADGELGVVGLPVLTYSTDGTIGLRNEFFDFYETSNWKKSKAASQGTGVVHLTTINEGRVLVSVTSDDVIEFWRVP